nr:MAG TPA: putative membrane protein [Caudoviricetes sp.]
MLELLSLRFILSSFLIDILHRKNTSAEIETLCSRCFCIYT